MILLSLILSSLVGLVNPFVGTDGHGHTFPGAAYPFGMVQLSPDTRIDTWDGCSGYHYSDSVILGFSHTHLCGTGVLDWGDVLVMPTRGYDKDRLDRNAYSSPFSHESEKAAPGYYEVYLEKPRARARLTVGRRFGFHEYTFDGPGAPQILIDLEHRDILQGSEIHRNGQVLTGFRRSKSWAENQEVHFYMEFDKQISEVKLFGETGALVTFPEGTRTVIIKVGISSVSPDNARMNLEAEIKGTDWSFDKQRQRVSKAWEKYLDKIQVKGGTEDERRNFYTALYHTAIHPSLYSDINGEYLGMDRKVHKAEGFERYTVFSIWDTFRAEHPLMCIIERKRTEDFLRSFLSIYREGGKLPVWELSGHETDCMIGYNSVSVIADAMAKGIVDSWPAAEIEELLEAAVVSSKVPKYGLDVFREHGVVIADKEHESVSKTLEYAYDDWCVSRIAEYVLSRPDCRHDGVEQIRDSYRHSSLYYRNIFDPSTGFMRARLNGRFLTPFDPREVNNHHTEANSWQYSFFVPHDIAGHIALLGGPEAYCAKIDALFAAPDYTSGRTQADITGLIGQYAHGNEPSHHIAFLYAYAGHPEKTAERVHEILRSQYNPGPDGLCGNEDCGQMSAWYVMSAMGLYSVCPGLPELVRTEPLFSKIRINLEDGGHMTIKAGDALKSMTPTVIESPIVLNPSFEMASDLIQDSESVQIKAENGSRIFWRRAGEEWKEYSGSIEVCEPCTLESYAERDGIKSFVTSTNLRKIAKDRTITLFSRYNRLYSAGGPEALIDGTHGSTNWRTGGWQGYQLSDFEAVVDLLGEREISYLSSGYCQDARSWLWMPTSVDYYISRDNENWTLAGTVGGSLGVDPQDYEIQTAEAEIKLEEPVMARYVKVVAHQLGVIPEWHLGAGGLSFIFIDEITIK